MLIIENLTAGYAGRVVLEIPRLVFAPQTVSVVLGPNGSGKSTLLRCLTGSLLPTKGTVKIGDKDRSRLSASQAAAQIAYVPQETLFPFAFTAGELVRMGAEAGKKSGMDAERFTQEALALFHVKHMADKNLLTLSGGERQRVSLARAFAQDAPCLLLDEPTAHLDLRYQAVLRNALQRAAHDEGKTVVVVLHDLNLAASFADEIVLLCNGKIAAQGASVEVLTTQNIERVYQTAVKLSHDTQTGARWITTEEGSLA